MADISVLARLLNGATRNVDLTNNTPVVLSIKVGGGVSNTELTKTLVDNLVTLSSGVDAGALHHHDGRYFTETELGSSSASSGSDLIGDDNTYSNFTPSAATVKGALAGIDVALATAGADEKVKISATDTTPSYLQNKIIVSTGTNTSTILESSIVNPSGNENFKIQLDQSKIDHGSIAGLADDDHTQYHTDARGDARYYQKTEFVTTSTPGAPIKLDGSGKISASQLPNSVMELQGFWDASTNTPTLADGSGNPGDIYEVSIAGSVNLGSGSITFAVGDWAVYAADGKWHKSINSNEVASVNGQTGTVTVNAINQLTGDVIAGPATGSQSKVATIAANAVTDTKLASDVSNDANRAVGSNHIKTSAVTTTKIADDAVDKTKIAADVAGSGLGQNVDGSLEVNVDGSTIEINTDSLRVKDLGITTAKLAATSVTAAKLGNDVAGAGLAGGNGSALSVGYSPSVASVSETAGETFGASSLFAVRYAQNAETLGRIYKADKDASSTDNFYVFGLVLTSSSVSAGSTLPIIVKSGLMSAPSHGFTVGKPVFLGASGALTSTPPSTATEAVVRVGLVKDVNTIDVQIQVIGVN
jgi:hypothetical protein